ncbi:PadR family transcriptional regulator [Carnobacterium gallinarum]|uniref:PadR family transcriptional regulator n=1 Tax=Carnobacterium gallinarum TaxID=2749 RepID=UPI0005526DA2|nr:PadR family transcriptional regulator [Carnobacterium gallinarum]
MDTSQILKGLLEGCILTIIKEHETYGYEMVTKLESYGLDMVSEGSIYPVLLKLQKQKYVSSRMLPSNEGPKRKYYSITPAGNNYLQEFQLKWNKISTSINTILDMNLEG